MSIHYNETNITNARPMAPPAPNGGFEISHEFAQFIKHTMELTAKGKAPGSLRAWVDLMEAWRITRTLRECGGNRSEAARTLGIGRRTLYAKMDKLGITPTWSY